jgi:hypothetical protein
MERRARNMRLQFPTARTEACVAANESCTAHIHTAPHERRRMSQIWKLVGLMASPTPALCQGLWVVTDATAFMAVSTAPPRCAPSREAATSPSGSSSSSRSTHRPLGTVPAPSASPWRTRAGKHSRAMDRVAGQFMRADGGRLGEPEKCDRSNDNRVSVPHHSEGGTS